MAKRPKPEEAVAGLRQVDVRGSRGQRVADAVRAMGGTEVTGDRWRREYGGLNSDQVRRSKALELESRRLRQAGADLTLDKLILAEAARGPMWSVSDRCAGCIPPRRWHGPHRRVVLRSKP